MNENDLDQVALLEWECFSTPWSKEEILKTFQRPDTIYCVVENENVVIGYIAMFYFLDEGNIINVAVKEEYRNAGVGKSLIEYLIEQSRKKGVENICLEVREGNKPAISLYEKMNFEISGIRKGIYQKPKENGIVMTLSIC